MVEPYSVAEELKLSTFEEFVDLFLTSTFNRICGRIAPVDLHDERTAHLRVILALDLHVIVLQAQEPTLVIDKRSFIRGLDWHKPRIATAFETQFLLRAKMTRQLGSLVNVFEVFVIVPL